MPECKRVYVLEDTTVRPYQSRGGQVGFSQGSWERRGVGVSQGSRGGGTVHTE